MALENSVVLDNLRKQRDASLGQLDNIRSTILRLDGAIDVLEQIEQSKVESNTQVESDTQTEVVGDE